jgi:hypothetical protein
MTLMALMIMIMFMVNNGQYWSILVNTSQYMIMIIVSFQSESTVLTLQRRLKAVIPGQRGLVWPEDKGILGQ